MSRIRKSILILLIATVFLVACGGERAVKTLRYIRYSKDGEIEQEMTVHYNKDGYATRYPGPMKSDTELIIEYDKNNRPLVETVNSTGGSRSYAYEYDKHGNMTEYKFCGDDSGIYETAYTMEYEYNQNNEVTSAIRYDNEKKVIERYEVSYEERSGVKYALYTVYDREGNKFDEGSRPFSGSFDVMEPKYHVEQYRYEKPVFLGAEGKEEYAKNGSLSSVRYELPEYDFVIEYTYY